MSIHETADVGAARTWWLDRLALSEQTVVAVTLKRHLPSPGRHNLGADYHGCIVVTVPQGRTVYWQMEGVLRGLATGVERA